MTAPSNNQLPEAWSAAAPGYAKHVGPWQGWANEALDLVPLRDTDVALDVATGPGTLALVAAGRAARVVAVDFSPGMLAELDARAASLGVRNVETRVMDAQALALADASFDAAYCLFAFMFFPDRAQAFRELHRVLVPSGRAVVATWAPIERRPLMQVGFEAMAEALPQVPRPGKGDLQTAAECEAEMSAAGFREVKAHTRVTAVPVASPEYYLEMTTESGAPFVLLKKQLGEQGWSAAKRRLLEALAKRIPPGGTSLAAEALFTVGTK